MRWTTLGNPRETTTPFFDKDGRQICIGDILEYKRRIRSKRRYDRDTKTYQKIPGKTDTIGVTVIGFNWCIKKFYRKGIFKEKSYLQVEYDNGPFQIYNSLLTKVISKPYKG